MATPFVIWFEGRSGSSLLVSLLNAHPDLLCRSEDFSAFRLPANDPPGQPVDYPLVRFNGNRFRRRLAGFDGVVLSPTVDQTLAHLEEIFASRHGAVGFKFKYPRQQGVFPEIAAQLAAQHDRVRLICLRRRNIVKRAVSKQNLQAILQQSGKCNLASPEQRIGKLSVDIPGLLEFCARVRRRQAGFDAWASQFRHVCRVEYEDLQGDRSTTLREIADFLNVDPEPVLQTDLVKSTPDRLSEAVANYDELVAAFRGTPLELWLDADSR